MQAIPSDIVPSEAAEPCMNLPDFSAQRGFGARLQGRRIAAQPQILRYKTIYVAFFEVHQMSGSRAGWVRGGGGRPQTFKAVNPLGFFP